MTAQIPATIADDIQQRLNPYLLAGGGYYSPDDWRVRVLLRDVQNLIRADAKIGYLAEARVFQLCGEVGRVKQSLEKSRKLAHDIDYEYAAVTCLINLGLFSEAQKHYEIATDPKNGQFTKGFVSGFACGALNKMWEFTEQAKSMKLDLSNLPIEKVSRIRQTLSDASLSDERIGQILDVAGEVMRDNHTLYVNETPDVDVADKPWASPQCVYLTFRLKDSASNVAKMYEDLSDRLCARFPDLPSAFHVSFQAI